MDCYKINGLSFRYPDAKDMALKDISFTVREGEFVTVCGLSGCGKSTLLRQLKTCLRPSGEASGEVLFQGRPLDQTDTKTQAASIGFVFQSPEHQCVTDKVWHELAFGLESLGLDQSLIRRRTAEMAAFFGMEKWFESDVEELSGGQRQILALAGAMVMQPSVLVLDEPTAQLDPVASYEFISLLKRINTEFSTTVIISEHSLEEVLPVSDRLIVLSEGRIVSDSTPGDAVRCLYGTGDPVFLSMPAPARVFEYADGSDKQVPLSSSQGKRWLSEFSKSGEIKPLPEEAPSSVKKPFISLRDIHYRYEKGAPDVLKGLSLDINRGEFLAVLGGNGAGKTTLLSLLCGESRPKLGRISIDGKKINAVDPVAHRIALLPQEPQSLFVRSTLREELSDVFAGAPMSRDEQQEKINRAVNLCGLGELLDMHPFDLSGGEQQKAALAKLLLTEPEILLLDEPTKGLDCFFRMRLAEIIESLTENGTTVIAVSHDLEFCAAHAQRCALLFDGVIVSADTPRRFFFNNGIYTTCVSKMSRGIITTATTVPELLAVFDINDRDRELYDDLKKRRMESDDKPPKPDDKPPPSSVTPMRKVLSSAFLAIFVFSLFVSSEALKPPFLNDQKLWGFAALFISACAFMLTLGSVGGVAIAPVRESLKSRLISAGCIFILVPLTVLFGVYFLDDTRYLFISLLILLESIVPFYIMFEKRSIRARELVLIGVICALTVAGRAVFYMLPECKPVTAIVILSGAALGCESGFMVGSVSMLASNIFFGQGIWTPWQMFTMGLIGYLSGIIFHRRLLPANRMSLALWGFLMAMLVYGGIMNPSSLIMSGVPVTPETLASVYALGLPLDTVHALATAVFLSVGAMPILRRLERIKRKYDLIR